ncbi:MAG TPA: lipopolysaccharide kinase InaA family protein [Gemmataceae bacterium]|nr:lipopolysaccharide kinase InaA family protein [Gemmataceae bacterium]
MFSHFLRKLRLISPTASGASVVCAGDRRWHLAPGAEQFFGHTAPDPERWIADGLAEVVKSGPHRTVYRVTLPAGVVYMKHCRISGFRAWAREVLRPPKARLEFENALALNARRIAAVVPLAWAERDSRWPGESYLITRASDGVPFIQFAQRTLPILSPAAETGVRRLLARTLGRFLADLHDAGVAHPDPHAGNLLVELPASRVPRFSLIDLHAVRVGRPLTWAESRANLVLYNRWFQLAACRADRLRFWHAYRAARRTLGLGPSHALDVERDTSASNLGFWASRESRCVGRNRYFRRLTGTFRGFAVADLPQEFLAELLADPDAAFAKPTTGILKDSRSSTVAELVMPTADGPRSAILKRFNVRRRHEPLKNLLRRSPALRSWITGHSLRDRWLPSPRPLAVFHRIRSGCPAEGYLLTEKVPDAIDLREEITRPGVLEKLARTVRAMHDRGVSHRDLKAPNVLLERGEVPVLIDLVGVQTRVRVSFTQRAKELARLNASFLKSPDVRHADRLRFLRAYLAAGPRRPEGWKSWWVAIGGATAAKVAKNRQSGRPLA